MCKKTTRDPIWWTPGLGCNSCSDFKNDQDANSDHYWQAYRKGINFVFKLYKFCPFCGSKLVEIKIPV